MNNSQYKIVAHKEGEVLYNDSEFLSKCSILIFKTESYLNDKNKIKYVYMEDVLGSKKFSLYVKITQEVFQSYPNIKNIPEYILKEICIMTKDDMKKLIDDGYEVYAFTSGRQYQKALAEYFIQYKHMYGPILSNKTDEEIYNEFLFSPKCVKDEISAKELTETVLTKFDEVEEGIDKCQVLKVQKMNKFNPLVDEEIYNEFPFSPKCDND